MDFFTKVLTALSGYRTYIVSLATGGIGIYIASGHVVPEWTWAILAALGLASIRAALNK